jgi:hypothetical protein
MRHVTLLFVLLLATLGLAATAKALPAPALGQPLSALDAQVEGEEESGDEGDPAESEEAEGCEPDEQEGESCDEGQTEEGEEEDECVLETADASVAANPGNGKVRVTVRYTASAPATFTLDYSLHGGKGGLHLGTARAKFHRAGVFHDVLEVGGRKLGKLQAARRFDVELHAVGTPGYCREDLTEAAPHRASRRHRAGA